MDITTVSNTALTPHIITDELTVKVRRYSYQGYMATTIAQALSVPDKVFRRWLTQGQADFEALLDTPEANLYEQLKLGEAEHEMVLLNSIHEASCKDWKAAAWKLERQFKTRKDNYNAHSVTENNTTITTKYDSMNDSQLNDYLLKLINKTPVIDIGGEEIVNYEEGKDRE